MLCYTCGFDHHDPGGTDTLNCCVCGSPTARRASKYLSPEYGLVDTTRPSQIEMATDIETAILNKEQITIEAGTGVGKTYAYLVPALAALKAEGIKSLDISTSTLALQRQLYNEVLPKVQRILGTAYTVNYIIGRNNYICAYLVEQYKDKFEYRGLYRWGLEMLQKYSGDLFMYTGNRHKDAGLIAVNAPLRGNQPCTTCPHNSTCAAYMQKGSFYAKINVFNHASLSYSASSVPLTLGALVIDEAHRLEDYLVKTATKSINPRMLELVKKESAGAARSTERRVIASAQNILAVMEGLPLNSEVSLNSIKHLLPDRYPGDSKFPIVQELVSTFTRINRIIRHQHPVAWVNKHGGLSVAPAFPVLMCASDVRINVSATIPRTFPNTLYKNKAELKTYVSPFDLKRQAMVYTPKLQDIPNRDAELNANYINAITQEIIELILASNGGAFVLFTSREDLQQTHERITEEFALSGNTSVEILSQLEGKEQALARFMEIRNGVLFGLRTFWEGVDIPGSRLRLVVVPKLPFPNPSDAMTKARMRILGNDGVDVFSDYSVPIMCNDLRQAAGRLIRTSTDKGVLALLDARCFTGTSNIVKHRDRLRVFDKNPKALRQGYGGKALAALDWPQVTSSTDATIKFLMYLATKD